MQLKRIIRRSKKVSNVYFAQDFGPESSKSDFLHKLVKYSEYSIGIGVLLYVLGFIIENVFLGAFGISMFDILKARYILIGFLFAIFLFAVGIPTLDIVLFFRDSKNIPFFKVIIRLFKNSIFLFAALYFIGLILEILAGPQDSLPLSIAGINPTQPLTIWISATFPGLVLKWLRAMAILGVFAIGILFIILIIMVLINPKIEGKRIGRKAILKEFFSNVKKVGVTPIMDLVGILFLFFFLSPMITSLIVFLTTNKISTGSPGSLSFSVDFSSVYFRFLIAVVLCYLAISIVFISIIYQGKVVGTRNNSTPRLLNRVTGWSYLLTIIIAFLIPIYIYGVYPQIPQQIGGGKPVKVEIIANTLDIQKKLQPPNCNPYLFDRTSKSILVLCTNGSSNEFDVLEVQVDQIKMILFKRDLGK